MVNRNRFATTESPGHHHMQRALLAPTSCRLPLEVTAKREAASRQSSAGRKCGHDEARPLTC